MSGVRQRSCQESAVSYQQTIPDPLGQHLDMLSNVYGKQNEREETFEVVGVVKNIKRYQVWEDEPEIFVPYDRHPGPYMFFEVRTAAAPLTLAASVKDAAQSVDRDQPVQDLQTMDEIVAQRFGEIRFPMTLVWSFTALALVLAAIGMYGVMSYSVSRRTHELAIRMALGAGHVIASYLYAVSPNDSLTCILMALGLACISVLACFMPARCATKVDPMVALRYE